MKTKRTRLSKQPKRARAAKRKRSTVPVDIRTYSDKNRNPEFAVVVYRALLRAAESARRTARIHGTPLHYWENGRVVAKRP